MGSRNKEIADMSFEPIPAVGEGSSAFDQPSLFYLTNRRLIEEWAALRLTAAASVNEWLGSTFRDRLAAAVKDLGLDTSYVRGPRSFHHVVVHPPKMPIIGTRPAFGVGAGWNSKNVDPESSIFVCARQSRNKTGAAATVRYLDAGGREFRQQHALRGRDEESWPIYKYLQSREQWWTDLDGLADWLVEESMVLIHGTLGALESAALIDDLGGPDESD